MHLALEKHVDLVERQDEEWFDEPADGGHREAEKDVALAVLAGPVLKNRLSPDAFTGSASTASASINSFAVAAMPKF
ncbi:MAG: hypothetical protein WDM88_07195 [Galbitalea sp.]